MTTTALPLRAHDQQGTDIHVLLGRVIREHLDKRANPDCVCSICQLDAALTEYGITRKNTPEFAARASIAAIDAAASWVADALNTIARLEDERALIKPEAIRRIMESRGIAATPAEKIVEADPEYAAHREKQRDAEVVKWAAAAAYESAKLTAKLDVALASRVDE